MNQPGWWLGLTPGSKGLLRKRLKESGYMGMEHGTTKVLEEDPLDVRARQLPEPDMEPGQSLPLQSLGRYQQIVHVWVGQELMWGSFLLIQTLSPTCLHSNSHTI